MSKSLKLSGASVLRYSNKVFNITLRFVRIRSEAGQPFWLLTWYLTLMRVLIEQNILIPCLYVTIAARKYEKYDLNEA